MKQLIAVVMIFGLLAACSPVKVVEVPVEVKVPVMRPCVMGMPTEPVYETTHLQANDSVCAMVDALLIERHQRMAYIKLLQARLTGCMKPDNAAHTQ